MDLKNSLSERGDKISRMECTEEELLTSSPWIRSKKTDNLIQSMQTDYGHTMPVKYRKFTYSEINYLLIIGSPSHEDHVPFERI